MDLGTNLDGRGEARRILIRRPIGSQTSLNFISVVRGLRLLRRGRALLGDATLLRHIRGWRRSLFDPVDCLRNSHVDFRGV
jgi:hypothetical protein